MDSNDLAGAFERVVADNSTYYLLGYNSSNPKQDGSFRKIEVRVTASGRSRPRALGLHRRSSQEGRDRGC